MRGAKVVLVGVAVIVLILAAVWVVDGPAAPAAAPLAVAPLPEPTTPSTSTTTTLPPPPTTVAPPAPAAVALAVPCVPDPMPAAPPSSEVASSNGASVAYAAAPGGPGKGELPAATWGGPTVRPVLGTAPGWVEVQLDTRPNASAGWVPQSAVTMSSTAYFVVVSTCRRTLTVFEAGNPIYSAPVGVGQAGSPTPLGPSFVDAFVGTPRSQIGVYGPEVVIIGSHSNVYTEFDGGNGTVAIHEYPSDPASTQGVASSHGCVRVSPTTLQAMLGVPVGTPLDIIN
ncbi:MAG: L,D-transpeptidase [Acidimicrobiales bacterium]